jgi:hypothetical protein
VAVRGLEQPETVQAVLQLLVRTSIATYEQRIYFVCFVPGKEEMADGSNFPALKR